jgi:hypothetical protein
MSFHCNHSCHSGSFSVLLCPCLTQLTTLSTLFLIKRSLKFISNYSRSRHPTHIQSSCPHTHLIFLRDTQLVLVIIGRSRQPRHLIVLDQALYALHRCDNSFLILDFLAEEFQLRGLRGHRQLGAPALVVARQLGLSIRNLTACDVDLVLEFFDGQGSLVLELRYDCFAGDEVLYEKPMGGDNCGCLSVYWSQCQCLKAHPQRRRLPGCYFRPS